MKLVYAFALLVPSVGLAQAAPSAPTTPAPLGRPHNCLDYYPAAAREGRIEGTTTLGFRITAEGTVSGISLRKSSGNVDLDQAAITCVKDWRYSPATTDGKPVDTPWEAMVKWEAGPAPEPIDPAIANAPVKFTETPRNCSRYYPVKAAQLSQGDGTTGVSFNILQGMVRDAAVFHSSGNATVDGYAVDCVKSWRFTPVVYGDNPVAVPRRAVIHWEGG